MGSTGRTAPTMIESTTDDGHRMIVCVAPGYTSEDALAELPAIRQEVRQVLTRLGRAVPVTE